MLNLRTRLFAFRYRGFWYWDRRAGWHRRWCLFSDLPVGIAKAIRRLSRRRGISGDLRDFCEKRNLLGRARRSRENLASNSLRLPRFRPCSFILDLLDPGSHPLLEGSLEFRLITLGFQIVYGFAGVI